MLGHSAAALIFALVCTVLVAILTARILFRS